jgi:hypothetical protein
VAVVTAQVGLLHVQLTGPGLLGRTNPLDVEVVADLGHLHFFDPTVAQAGTRSNRTFWRIADEFGNPAPGAAIEILYSSSDASSEVIEAAIPAGNGTTGAWVNFTAPTDAGGTLEVTDTAGTVLLAPIPVPPAAAAGAGLSAPVITIATAIPLGAVGLGLTAWAQRRRRAVPGDEEGPTDADLRRLVAGRDRVIALVRDARAVDLAGLEAAWGSPAPPELADWVASLVADGTLGARTGPDGVARFCLIASADGPPIVVLDPTALDRATAARRALTEEAAGPAADERSSG